MGSHVDALPDDTLELVLLGLQSPLWLLWAASTCKRWQRVICGAGFTRSFRDLHNRSPVIAGFYCNKEDVVRPQFEPSPAAAAVDVRHFSLDFVPGNNDTCRWSIKDSRGSLLMIHRKDWKTATGRHDLIVCEPLTRCHEVIPQLKLPVCYRSLTAILLDGDDDGAAIGMSSFRVLCLVQGERRICAGTFTSGSSSWRETCIDAGPQGLCHIGAAAGRWFWHNRMKKVIAFDQSTLEFSSFMLPLPEAGYPIIVPVGRDGEARIVVGTGGHKLKIFARLQVGGGGGGEEWALEKTIRLAGAMLGLPWLQFWHYNFTWDQPDAGMVQIEVSVPSSPTPIRLRLDMETKEGERLPGPYPAYVKMAYAYPSQFPWPPSLRDCTDHNA